MEDAEETARQCIDKIIEFAQARYCQYAFMKTRQAKSLKLSEIKYVAEHLGKSGDDVLQFLSEHASPPYIYDINENES